MLVRLPFATAYLDDIVVVSHSSDEHRSHVRAIIVNNQRIRFIVRLWKRSFKPSISYPGFIATTMDAALTIKRTLL
jgi:hypothetical protein